MPDAVASRAETSRTTAIATCGPLRPFPSSSMRQTLHAPPSRKPPNTSRTRPKFTGLQRALGGGHVGDPWVDRDRLPQGPGQRLELALDDVVGVAAGVEHPHVQADPRVEGE